MTRFIPLTVAAPLALAALSLPVMSMPAGAQQMVQSLASTDADLLAAQMRQLAANPRDVNALATAGELSLKLGDLSAAASLFARADKVDSGNGRVKAGMAAILVRSERPGEALRFYEQAERSGLPTVRYAADRGLAYDLVGEQERAQRDYRAALAVSRDDETVRRYALSLGISGRQAQALEQLDPLIRRQDRAGWRAQAFVLAMNGDTAAATKIVTAMMPGNLAQGLAAFFQRLPSLSPVDRAFAVHFGEIQPTPERIADARLTPKLPPLAGSPPVQVAAVAPATVTRPVARDTRRTRTAAPIQTPPARNVPVQRTPVQNLPTQAPPVQVAAVPTPAASSPPVVWAAPRAVVQPLPPTPEVAAPVAVAAAPVAPVQSSAATQRADSVLARIVANLSIPAEELGVVEPTPAASRAPLPVKLAAAPASAAGRRVVAEASAKEARDTAVRRVVAARLTGNAAADDAAIPLTRAQQRAADRKAAMVDAKGKPLTAAQRRAAARKPAIEDATAVAAVEDEKPLTPAQKRAAARKAAAEEKAMTPAEKRAAARKEAAETKKATDRKALADKAAADKKAARSNPARIWVQVASGANDAYLGQAWKTITAKAPQAFRGKAGYTQSVRATNRVMTGPFKTDAEARAFVNQLAKQGVPAYSVSTDAGEPVAKLPAR
ncbi:hypothetical protein GCM10022268_08680 [Sphingomonas cynarae]|uniref:SPOR domain-containing protein n=1 Tax=Sphingomonas cynarae TaxID=930197 RepID=A0ABP7D8P5_9SPHN